MADKESGCEVFGEGEGVILKRGMLYFTKRAKTDQSLKGIKTLYKENPEKALRISEEIIKNTYRTLMTRGMKGCYVYCTNQGLAEYLKMCLNRDAG